MSKTRIGLRKEWDGNIRPDSGFQYALAYMMSEMRLIPFEKWEEIDLDECLEARIFGKDAELHIFREDDKWMAVSTQDLPDDNTDDDSFGTSEAALPGDQKGGTAADSDSVIREFAFIDRAHPIRKNCRTEIPKGYNEIIIREYISYDEDGQARTAKTRLVEVQD